MSIENFAGVESFSFCREINDLFRDLEDFFGDHLDPCWELPDPGSWEGDFGWELRDFHGELKNPYTSIFIIAGSVIDKKILAGSLLNHIEYFVYVKLNYSKISMLKRKMLKSLPTSWKTKKIIWNCPRNLILVNTK